MKLPIMAVALAIATASAPFAAAAAPGVPAIALTNVKGPPVRTQLAADAHRCHSRRCRFILHIDGLGCATMPREGIAAQSAMTRKTAKRGLLEHHTN